MKNFLKLSMVLTLVCGAMMSCRHGGGHGGGGCHENSKPCKMDSAGKEGQKADCEECKGKSK